MALAPAAAQTLPEKLIEQGHWKRARALVEPRYRTQPDDALANFLLSQIRNAFGDHQSPLPLAERAVRLDPAVARYHRQLAEVLGVTAQHAGMLQQLFLARRFKKEIDIALAQDPHDLQALRDLMEFYLLAPGIAGGDREAARASAVRIEHRDSAQGYLAQARLADFEKQSGQVADLLHKAAQAQPLNYRAGIALANYYLEPANRRYDLAAQHAREALNIDPDRIDAYAILAATAAARAAWNELDALLARAETAVPDDLTPCYRAAESIIASGRDLPRAARLLRKYLEIEPEGNAPTHTAAQRLLATLPR